MIKKSEIIPIISAIILVSIVLNFINFTEILTVQGGLTYAKNLGFSMVIVLVPLFAKKLAASSRDIEIKHSIWKFKRYGFKPTSRFKNPMPIGIILPLLVSIATNGFTKCLTILQFDAKALSSKAAKKYGSQRFSEIMETDLAYIAFWGLIATLILAIVASIFVPLASLARFAFYYAAWNLLPIGKLDGNKIFFGSEPVKTDYFIIPPPLYIVSIIITVLAGLIVLL